MKHNVRRATVGVLYRAQQSWWRAGHRRLWTYPRLTRSQRIAMKVMPERLAKQLEREVPGLVVERNAGGPNMGGACPWQLEGTYEGHPCYMRFRHDNGGMTVWKHEAWGEGDVILVGRLPGYTGDTWNGYLDDDEVVPFVKALVATLTPPEVP